MTTERPLLAISRKDLDDGPKQVRAELPAEWLSKHLTPTEEEGTDAPELTASQPGKIDVRLTPSGGEAILVQGKIDAVVDAPCARCLEPAHVTVAGEITLLLVPKQDPRARKPKGRTSKDSEGEFEFDADEADVEHYDGETIVLDPFVREAILLEMPISPLCSEGCSGMASDPAVASQLEAARIDPRLAPLAALAQKAKGESKPQK